MLPSQVNCLLSLTLLPGLVVHASSSVLRAAKWLRGSFRGGGSRTNGVVSEIRPGEVTVDWLAGSGHGGDAPPGTLSAALCFPLTYYAHTCWQLGDRAVVDDAAPDEYYREPESSLLETETEFRTASGVFVDVEDAAGPGSYCSPRHRMLSNS